MQLGTNDRLLHDSYGVKFVCVCQTIRRRSATAFSKNVDLFTRYLRVVLEPIPYAICWGHRGFWKARHYFFVADGVHLNSKGNISSIVVLKGQCLSLCSCCLVLAFSSVALMLFFTLLILWPCRPAVPLILTSTIVFMIVSAFHYLLCRCLLPLDFELDTDCTP